MSIQPDRVTLLETIEHLDFEATLPCEHDGHGRSSYHYGPATVLVRRFAHCPDNKSRLLALCEGVWQQGVLGVRCRTCGAVRPRDEAWLFIERIGGAS